MQILRFYTYFIESIQDQGTEIERRRRCTILYFLEDDSVQVMEPVEHNSGIPQGEDDSDEGYRNIVIEALDWDMVGLVGSNYFGEFL